MGPIKTQSESSIKSESGSKEKKWTEPLMKHGFVYWEKTLSHVPIYAALKYINEKKKLIRIG